MPLLIEKIENLLIKSNAYFIRLNKHPDYQGIIEGFAECENIKSCLCVEHGGNRNENPHYHLCIHTDQKDQAVRKWFKSRFTAGKGNAHMSIKEWDKEAKAIQYCFHEATATIILNKGYSECFINSQKEKALIYENEKKTYTSKLEEKALCLIKSQICEKKDLLEHRFICFKIWDVCRDEKIRFPNKFQLDGLIQSIQAMLTQGENPVVEFSDQKVSWYARMYPHEY